MDKFLLRTMFLLLLLPSSLCMAQKQASYKLGALIRGGGLIIPPNQHITSLPDDAQDAVSLQGIVWLKDVRFSTGSIDVDIRGKNIFQQSFVGIAFHGVDTVTYECVYFRPFNFQSPDSLRLKHAVQYISQPDYPWDRLRNEYPLVYENQVTPMPQSTAWFHAHIVVDKDSITVYVDQLKTYSLKVKRLSNRDAGLIGLWSSGLSGDFANLIIKPMP